MSISTVPYLYSSNCIFPVTISLNQLVNLHVSHPFFISNCIFCVIYQCYQIFLYRVKFHSNRTWAKCLRQYWQVWFMGAPHWWIISAWHYTPSENCSLHRTRMADRILWWWWAWLGAHIYVYVRFGFTIGFEFGLFMFLTAVNLILTNLFLSPVMDMSGCNWIKILECDPVTAPPTPTPLFGGLGLLLQR